MLLHWSFFHPSSVWCTIWESRTQKINFHHGNDASWIQPQTLLYLLQKQCVSPNSFTIHRAHPKAIIDTGESMIIHRVSVSNNWSPHQSCLGRASAITDQQRCILAVFVFVAARSVCLPTCYSRESGACRLEQLWKVSYYNILMFFHWK